MIPAPSPGSAEHFSSLNPAVSHKTWNDDTSLQAGMRYRYLQMTLVIRQAIPTNSQAEAVRLHDRGDMRTEKGPCYLSRGNQYQKIPKHSVSLPKGER